VPSVSFAEHNPEALLAAQQDDEGLRQLGPSNLGGAMKKSSSKVAVRVTVLAMVLVALGSVGIVGGFCPDCNYCPPDYSEKIGWANCEECETDQCWILWPITQGWPWFVNIADHMKIPGTSYTCWDTTTCVDDDCLPIACDM